MFSCGISTLEQSWEWLACLLWSCRQKGPQYRGPMFCLTFASGDRGPPLSLDRILADRLHMPYQSYKIFGSNPRTRQGQGYPTCACVRVSQGCTLQTTSDDLRKSCQTDPVVKIVFWQITKSIFLTNTWGYNHTSGSIRQYRPMCLHGTMFKMTMLRYWSFVVLNVCYCWWAIVFLSSAQYDNTQAIHHKKLPETGWITSIIYIFATHTWNLIQHANKLANHGSPTKRLTSLILTVDWG